MRRIHDRLPLGRRVVSLVGSALMVLATGVVALVQPAVVALADPGLPDVTVHVTTAPMTNLTAHTGVTRTASCPAGSLAVGGGGYLRNAADPTTAPTNGLVLGGTNPSTGTSPVDQPVANGATNPSNWMAIGNFTGASETGDQAAAFAMCSSNGPAHTVVSSITTAGANATQESQPPILTIATCPAGTTLIGGGAFSKTPDQVNDGTTVGNSGNLKPLGSYPSDSAGMPATDRSTSATSWSAYGSAGMKNTTDTVTSLALCTSDPIGPVQVARQDISSTTGGVITATPVCPTGTRLLGGGFRFDETVSGISGLQPQQGYHMRGSYPSSGSGTPPTEVTDGANNPTAWTALVQAGGASSTGSADLHGFAMCAQPTSNPTPTPTPTVSPTPTPTVSPTPTPAPIVSRTTLIVPAQVRIDGLGVLVVADARVTSVNDGRPVGTVQFKDGTTNVGNPVPVIGGHALLITFRPAGSHLTAVYLPAPGSRFLLSTSNTVTITG